MPKVIVIGAGFGGIAASLRLKKKGYDVEIVDQCLDIGGRAQVYESQGYKFDAGPTVLTATFLFDELFKLFGKHIDDYITIKSLNPWYQFIFPDGRKFNYGGSTEEILCEIEKFNPADKVNYLNLLKESKKIFKIAFEDLSAEPFHNFLKMASVSHHLVTLKSYRSVWSFISSHIKDPFLRQAFSIQPLLVGGNPFDTTSIYSLIHYLETKWGIHFAIGGTGALLKGFKKLMLEEGIKLTLNTSVQEIIIENGFAKGIRTKDKKIMNADIIISNTDAAFLYKNLIKKKHQSISAKLKVKFARYSMGLFVLYFGTSKKYKHIEHHTIWLGKRYKELLSDIFNHKTLAEDFSLYLHRPTATDPSFAPDDCDSFYVLAPVPNLQASINWNEEGPKLRSRIIKALDETILPGLARSIEVDFYKTPEDFQTDYCSVYGAGFSIAPLLSQSAWFRFHNKAEGIANLYLVGAGTHPGAGLPGVLCSAKVVDSLINAA